MNKKLVIFFVVGFVLGIVVLSVGIKFLDYREGELIEQGNFQMYKAMVCWSQCEIIFDDVENRTHYDYGCTRECDKYSTSQKYMNLDWRMKKTIYTSEGTSCQAYPGTDNSSKFNECILNNIEKIKYIYPELDVLNNDE